MKLAWMTDLHLDQATPSRRSAFIRSLRGWAFDVAVVTGDISCGSRLAQDLGDLARAVAPRPVYFCLGNHDYYGSSFRHVGQMVTDVCRSHANLRPLGHGEIIPLGSEEALVGHGGWADGRAGIGERTTVRNPDFESIEDFRGLNPARAFQKLRELGRASGRYFRSLLPYALSCYRRVWVATHVPPVFQAVRYSGACCGYPYQPFFANLSAGASICGIARHYPSREVRVLCGHTHSPALVELGNISVLAGAVTPGVPAIQRIFELP